MASRGLCTRVFLLLSLLVASATLATGFFGMHYKVFLDLLDLPKFRDEFHRWGYDETTVRSALKARGKEYATFLRLGASAVVLTFAVGQGFRGILLAPVWASLVAAAFSWLLVQDVRAMVLYVVVLIEKCYLSEVMPLGLEQSGKDLTKRVARLPKDMPFAPSVGDLLALQRLGVLLAMCFMIWMLLQWYHKKEKKE
ncbi:unnamed protein product [Durusdinium trenchii]|uniref:Uncharacterized protein n=1 Tax=Durusdinium trenchii TaxID=1381693 RepID=A0ABP0LMJ9_9DINO